jgi:hypothetical protein
MNRPLNDDFVTYKPWPVSKFEGCKYLKFRAFSYAIF